VRRVTADTNILVSALTNRRGKPFELIRMALEGEISLTVSRAIIAETLDVLSRKFGVQLEELPAYQDVIESGTDSPSRC
jgi:putative PIN family toxin of toxin-antitoxin system